MLYVGIGRLNTSLSEDSSWETVEVKIFATKEEALKWYEYHTNVTFSSSDEETEVWKVFGRKSTKLKLGYSKKGELIDG